MDDREAGLAALNDGRLEEAVGFLQKAVAATPDDGAVFQYLAVAQSRSGSHAAAVESITRAVTLDPGNAQARFNMALVLNQAGWPEQAMQAAEQAITLRPDYAQASQLLDQLRAKVAAPSPSPQPQPAAVEPTIGAPVTGGSPPTSAGQTGPTPLGGGPIPLAGGASPGAYGQAPLPGGAPYGAPAAMPRYLNVPAAVEDRFDLLQTWRDAWAVIMSPSQFFAGQLGREGKNAPYAAIVLMALVTCMSVGIGMLVKGQAMFGVLAMVLGTAGLTLVFLIASYIFGGLLHMFARMFGGNGAFDSSYRVTVYSHYPRVFLTAVGLLVAGLMAPAPQVTAMRSGPGTGTARIRVIPAQFNAQAGNQQAPPPFPQGYNGYQTSQAPPPMLAGTSNPLYGLASLIGLVWWFVVAIIGVARVHQIGTGAAFGAVFLATILPGILLIALAVATVLPMIKAMQPH
ncbi:MAG: YIP1 family protein [Armatimonadetes bacterium]|nr:YIP1 family protein [Armatimonadota bacterium]MDE2207449.1 YIP1 family protein [Armatimonadota bacterium]